MAAPGVVRIAFCLALGLVAAGCDRYGPPAPVTYRVERPPQYAPPPRQYAPQYVPPPSPQYTPPRYTEPPPQRSVERVPERPVERPPERAAASGTVVTVGPGETLYAVARRTNVPLRSLIETNNLQPPFRLNAGTRLVLPQVQEYVAQQGDTVTSVSRRFGVDSSTLASTNNLSAPYAVQSGAPLLLPPPVQTTAPGGRQLPPVETPRPQSIPAPASEARPAPLAPPPTPVTPPPAVVASLPPTVAAPPASVVAPVVNPPPALAESTPPPVAGHGFRTPVKGSLLAGYGPGPNGTQNDGINIAAPAGTPIVAVGDGVVKYAGNELRGFGNLILIKHADGWISAYAHCETLLVKRDQQVRAGQEIAKVGATGDVGAPQLHFELRRGTRAVDPTGYLPPIATAAAP